MKKRIFEKDENGNYIINFANIDFDYYSLVANSDTSDLDRLSFLVLSIYDEDENLFSDLKKTKLSEDKRLVSRVGYLKEELINFANKKLKSFNPKITDEESQENLLAILDEYEKVLEYKMLQSLVQKPEITQADLDRIEEKRRFMYESLVGVRDIHAFVVSNIDLCNFILNNRNYDEQISKDEKEKPKGSRFSFHYNFLRKSLSKEEIDEAREIVLEYKRRFKLDNLSAISDILLYSDMELTQELFDRDRELIKLVFEREKEYGRDLRRQKREDKRKKEEDVLRKEKEEAAKRKKEVDKYFNFETYGTYGPRERVLPLGINYFGKRGKTITEDVGEQVVDDLFKKIKEIPFRRNERPAIVIFSDCSREEALKVLEDFREKAKKNGFDERVIEGITTEYGDELIFDETTSRPVILRGIVDEKLQFMRMHNKEKYPNLIELNADRSYLTYSLETISKNPNDLEKLRRSLKDYIGIVRYIEDDKNGILYGIPREKTPIRVRERVARYLGLKYQIDKKVLDAFQNSKKLSEYEIDTHEEETK